MKLKEIDPNNLLCMEDPLRALVETVIKKLSPTEQERLLQILSIAGVVPANISDLGIPSDRYLNSIPERLSTVGWNGTAGLGAVLLHIFSLDPSELAVLVTLNKDDLRVLSKELRTSLSANKIIGRHGSLNYILRELTKFRLEVYHGV